MSTHNICFHEEISKIYGYPYYWSGAKNKYPEEGLIKTEYIFDNQLVYKTDDQ